MELLSCSIAIASAVMAGVFFAFSSFIMTALGNLQPAEGVSLYFLVASILYLVGSFLVTGVGNVPLNNALARVDPDSHEAIVEWHAYLVHWTRWNHVRAAACLAACVVIVGARYVQ